MKKTKYTIKLTSKFKKDYKKMQSRQNFDRNAFIKVINMLANGETLPEKYNNHLLEPKSMRLMGMSYKTRLVVNLLYK